MFYSNSLEKRFRLGDIIHGFAAATPLIDNPPIKRPNAKFQIEIEQADFYAILSPCCSINEQVIMLCPLVQISVKFLRNPYWAEDLTLINKPMMPEQSTPPDIWKKLSSDEKMKRIEVGLSYALVEYFVYEMHDIFPEYTLSSKERKEIVIKNYMIDFRQVFTVKCKQITNNSTPFENTKILELSIASRDDLRSKLASFYSRVPVEDRLSGE